VAPRYDLPRAAPGELRLVQLFVNTLDAEHGRDDFASASAFARWTEASGVSAPGRVRSDQLADARRLRAALRELLLARHDGRGARPGASATVNAAARRGDVRVECGADGTVRVAAHARAAMENLLGSVAAAAYGAMIDGSWERLKACRNCRWAYYDASRNRSATWCSMAICGNRLKTRAYRQRARR
jgi:predicted RNA-binding Zn ribbon-like protein